MIRRTFFQSWVMSFLALKTKADGAERNRGATGDDLEELKNRVATLEDNMKTQRTSSPPNVPIGTILPYAGPIDAEHPLPAGWMLCDGASIKASEYGSLWEKFRIQQGTTVRGAWGGDGNPNFNLPDLMGRFLRGVDKNKDGQVSTPARDPDRDLRTASKPNGNTGNNVGSA